MTDSTRPGRTPAEIAASRQGKTATTKVYGASASEIAAKKRAESERAAADRKSGKRKPVKLYAGGAYTGKIEVDVGDDDVLPASVEHDGRTYHQRSAGSDLYDMTPQANAPTAPQTRAGTVTQPASPPVPEAGASTVGKTGEAGSPGVQSQTPVDPPKPGEPALPPPVGKPETMAERSARLSRESKADGDPGDGSQTRHG